MNFYAKIEFEKNWGTETNRIICFIFEVKGPKYIFLKISATSFIFDIFFILVFIFQLPLLLRKQK